MSEELQNDDVQEKSEVEQRKEMLRSSMFVSQVDNQDEVEQPTKTPNKKGKNDRTGMFIAGVSKRRAVSKPKELTVKEKQSREKRRGIYRPFADKPIKDVGEGTNTLDISKRRVV